MDFGILDTQDEIAYILEPKKRDFVLPLRRIVTPDEIAAICSFLAGEDSSLLTGAVLVVEGGTFLIDAKGGAMNTVFPDGRKG